MRRNRFLKGPDDPLELVQCDVHVLRRDVQIVIGVDGFAGEVRIH
jgi:hypothetical protein